MPVAMPVEDMMYVLLMSQDLDWLFIISYLCWIMSPIPDRTMDNPTFVKKKLLFTALSQALRHFLIDLLLAILTRIILNVMIKVMTVSVIMGLNEQWQKCSRR